MVLSVSRRTDIPAFYPDWFVSRLREGVVYVQIPFNQKNVYRIEISPENIDFIVFWTKNPLPLIEKLSEIEKLGYRDYYFLFTLNNYPAFELNLPSLKKRIDTFKVLSEKIGSDKVIWRYDPILLSETYNASYHMETFSKISEDLCGYTNYCKTSFLTHYKKIIKRIANESPIEPDMPRKREIIKELQKVGKSFKINLELCCEQIDDFEHLNSGCINKNLIQTIISSGIDLKRDHNQRSNCMCVKSIDIGAYNTCNHQCVYCYANSGKIEKNTCFSNSSPLLGKDLNSLQYNLIERKIQSNKTGKEPELFE